MILLNMYIPKMTYAQERAYRLQVEKDALQAKRDYFNAASVCCKATVRTVYNPHAQENEVRTIRVCNNCNTEAPKIDMFQEWSKVNEFFINLNQHKTNNK